MKKYIIVFISLILCLHFFASEPFFLVDKTQVGDRALHIDLGINSAVICDYNGKINIIDYNSFKKASYEKLAVTPMASYYDGKYLYLIDNYKKNISKYSEGKLVKQQLLTSKPINMKYNNEKLYIVTNSPYQLFILNKELEILKTIPLPSNSPQLKISDDSVYAVAFDGSNPDYLFYEVNSNSFIPNSLKINYAIDLEELNNKKYIISFKTGKLYSVDSVNQKEVASFNRGYVSHIEKYKNNIIGGSFFGGIFFYDTEKNITTSILNDIPIIDLCISKNLNYIFAISHITNKLYIIQDMKVIQELDVEEYPIDIESPDDNTVLVLSTEDQYLQIFKKY